MSAAGLAARTGRNATRRLVAKSRRGDCPEHYCIAPDSGTRISLSKAIENPGFIGIDDIKNTYLPMGFSNFKIEGRGLGSVMILEFLLYYMTKPRIRYMSESAFISIICWIYFEI